MGRRWGHRATAGPRTGWLCAHAPLPGARCHYSCRPCCLEHWVPWPGPCETCGTPAGLRRPCLEPPRLRLSLASLSLLAPGPPIQGHREVDKRSRGCSAHHAAGPHPAWWPRTELFTGNPAGSSSLCSAGAPMRGKHLGPGLIDAPPGRREAPRPCRSGVGEEGEQHDRVPHLRRVGYLEVWGAAPSLAWPGEQGLWKPACPWW